MKPDADDVITMIIFSSIGLAIVGLVILLAATMVLDEQSKAECRRSGGLIVAGRGDDWNCTRPAAEPERH